MQDILSTVVNFHMLSVTLMLFFIIILTFLFPENVLGHNLLGFFFFSMHHCCGHPALDFAADFPLVCGFTFSVPYKCI